MVSALINKRYYLRFVFSLLLLAFTGCKIVTPVYLLAKVVYKEITSAPDDDNDKVDELAEWGQALEKSPDFIASRNSTLSHWQYYTHITHYTAYTIHYQTSNYLTITGPPPDIYLHTTV